MKNYEYHRIGELAKQLGKAGIRQKTIEKIMEGGENILRKTSPKKKAGNEAFSVFGGCVRMQENGEVLVRFAPEGLNHYRCACLPGADKPLPITYCFCCGGHVKYHLQISLGRQLDYTIRSTALSSGGKSPCTFSFRIKE